MLIKLTFPVIPPDVDMLRCKEQNNFATECIVPRRPKRNLPPLPEDKECSNIELKKFTMVHKRKHRRQCLLLPALPEFDEC